MSTSESHTDDGAAALPSCRLLDAARGVNRGRPPIWIMRQAGRYLPEYQEIRAHHSFVEMCSQPDLAFEVSMQPRRIFGFDAVIVFYDILFLPEAMGAPLEFTEKGPTFRKAVRTLEDVRALRIPDPREHTGPILETLKRLRAELPPEVAVLGFAGAPFTIAAYLVEGDFRRSGERIKRMMYEEPDTLRELLEMIAAATGPYLAAQVEAGAGAVQLFDTWAGLLGPEEYVHFALPYQKSVFQALAPGSAEGAPGDGAPASAAAPTILYVNGSAHLLDPMALSGADVLSVDWRVALPEVRRRVGSRVALQGNMDPASLYAGPQEVKRRAREVLASMADDPAYIFNLGHGILPQVPVDSVRALVEAVHEMEDN